MYTRNSSSPENTLQYRAMVNSMWSVMRADIAASRGIAEADLDGAIDNLKLCLPEDFLKEHLADGRVTRQGLKDKLATIAVADSFKDVKFIPFPDYVKVKSTPNLKAKDKVAVIYADGDIVDGRDLQNVAGDHFASIIDKVRTDSSGYWISNNCDKIYTDAVTLTGSIGVFGTVPDFGKTAKNVLKVGVETVSSNKHGDMYSLMRPLDSAEYNYIHRSIETIYTKFTTIVSEGRGLPVEKVDEIGQGRVWTGADALGISLVDEIGTLSDAISYAAVAGGVSLDEVMVAEYPEPLTPVQQLMQLFGGKNPEQEFVKNFAKPQVVARMPFEITVY